MSHSEQNVLPSGMKKTAIQQRERAAAKRARRLAEDQRAHDQPSIDAYTSAVQETQKGEFVDEGKLGHFSRESKPVINEDFFLGRSRFSPIQVALQAGRTTPERGIPGEIFEEGTAIIKGFIEAGSELADIITGRDETTQRDILDKPIVTGGNLGFGELKQEPEKREPEEDPTDSSIAQIHRVAAETEARIKADEAFILTIDQQTSDDPVVREAANTIREEKEVEIAELENNLLRLQDKLDIQDTITEVAIDEFGLADALDLKDLEESLAKDGGLGSESYLAILALADNLELTEEQRNEGIDIVLARSVFAEELLLTINDMVENKANLEEFIARPDFELVDDVVEFLRPTFNFALDGENDAQRFEADMRNTFDMAIEVPDNIPDGDVSIDIYTEMIRLVMQFGVDDDEVTDGIEALATAWHLEETDIRAAFKAARKLAVENKEAWDFVANQDTLIPGSKPMVAAIYQAGEEIGYDPGLLEKASMYKGLHALIDVQSQGVSGRKGEGTIAGVGGLTLQTYIDVMGEDNPWSPTQGMAYELQALLEYVRQTFGGDAFRAVKFWRDTGEWGGTESLPNNG